MNVQFEFIKGFLLGIDYVEDIEIPEYDTTADLLRVCVGIVFIHFFFIKFVFFSLLKNFFSESGTGERHN